MTEEYLFDRLVLEGPAKSPKEIDTEWTLGDVFRFNDWLDYRSDAEHEYNEWSKKQK